MTGTDGQPYWLIREPGKHHGFSTVEFTDAPDRETALAVFRNNWDKQWKPIVGEAPPHEAILVTLTYVDGQPVVQDVC